MKLSGLNNNQQRNEAGLAQYRRHTENDLLISYHCLYEASEKEVISNCSETEYVNYAGYSKSGFTDQRRSRYGGRGVERYGYEFRNCDRKCMLSVKLL